MKLSKMKWVPIALALMATCAVVGTARAQTDANTTQETAEAGVVGNAQDGMRKVSMCIGCHSIPGYKTAFPEVYFVPKIAGQNARYIETALMAYATEDRTHPSMVAIAKSLTEQDIADVAAYYSALK